MKNIFFLIILFLSILFLATYVSSLKSDFGVCTIDANTCDTNQVNITNNSGLIPMYLFYSPNCSHCKNVEVYLEELEKDYNLNVVAINRDLNNSFFVSVVQSFEGTSFGVPVLVINDHFYQGDITIKENLKKELDAYKEKPYGLYKIKEKPKPINFWTMTGLAIADSINPCEIAVLLILLSSILVKYNSKRKVLFYGLAFIITIYAMYFILGIVAIFGFKLLGNVNTTIFYIVFGVLALLFGLLNLKDAVSYGAGGFVMEVPRAWRPTMKKILENITSIWSAIIIAIIISLFLLPCTAGPYAVTTALLSQYSWLGALLWLLYYNVIFSLPMWIILGVVYFGLIKVETIQNMRERNIKTLHLIASIILILLGILLILWNFIF
jgi:thiol-disulfide isomerase/thioredoxin